MRRMLEPSQRELEVLRLLAQGMTNREIAETLYISPHTVKEHVSNILMKLDASDRTQAAVLGIELGYVSLGDAVRGARASGAEGSIQLDSGTDKRQMAEGLWKVA
jgi:DNA-binding CsgD family transcriptional regulator